MTDFHITFDFHFHFDLISMVERFYRNLDDFSCLMFISEVSRPRVTIFGMLMIMLMHH